MTKTVSSWWSPRLQREVALARWGHWGWPVLLFPTAGGDAEEAERMGLVGALWPLIEAGRIKVYSPDSVAGRALVAQEGSDAHRSWLLNQFHEYVAHEVVPAIWSDSGGERTEVLAAGASIGAFNAVAVTCRYPWHFRAALGMSGTYEIEGLRGFRGDHNHFLAAPLAFLPGLHGPQLDELRRRFVLMTFGQGRWESPEETWRMANALGSKGVPNRVVPWGPSGITTGPPGSGCCRFIWKNS